MSEEEYQEAAENVANSLHELAQIKEREAQWCREAAHGIITGRNDPEDFVEQAKERDLDLAEHLPDL